MNIALLKLQSIMTKTMHSESEFIHIYTCALSSCLFRHQMLICFMVVTLATWQLQAHRFWEQRPHDHPITWSPWSSSAERMMPVSQCFQNPKPKKDWNDPGGTWTLRFHQYDIPWGCRLRSEIGPCFGWGFQDGFLVSALSFYISVWCLRSHVPCNSEVVPDEGYREVMQRYREEHGWFPSQRWDGYQLLSTFPDVIKELRRLLLTTMQAAQEMCGFATLFFDTT